MNNVTWRHSKMENILYKCYTSDKMCLFIYSVMHIKHDMTQKLRREGVQEEWCLIDKSNCIQEDSTWKCWVEVRCDLIEHVWRTYIHSKGDSHPYAQTRNNVHVHIHTDTTVQWKIFREQFLWIAWICWNFYYSLARFTVNVSTGDQHRSC